MIVATPVLLTVKDAIDTKAIFISHTHIDHFVNFDFFLRHQLGAQKNYVICGPKGITKNVKNRISSYTWNLINEGSVSYEVREIISPELIQVSVLKPPSWEITELETITNGIIYKSEKFSVKFAILDHKTPSISYKFEEKDTVKIDISKSEFKPGKWIKELKEAFENGHSEKELEISGKSYLASDLFHLLEVKKGASLGVIMDHAAHKANHKLIKELFSNCDKVFIESFYKAEEKEMAEANFHSYSTASGKIMKECGVKEAIPVHFSRKYNEDDLREILAEFNGALGK